MKRQRLLLTGLGAVLTEEAKKKLEDIEEDSYPPNKEKIWDYQL